MCSRTVEPVRVQCRFDLQREAPDTAVTIYKSFALLQGANLSIEDEVKMLAGAEIHG
jgi:hypothetical protein